MDLGTVRARRTLAFYGGLGAALWDVAKHGFHLWNTAFLAALCGVTLAGMASLIQGKKKAESED